MPEGWTLRSFEEVAHIRQGLVDPKSSDFSEHLHIGPDSIDGQSGCVVADLRSAGELGLISGKFLFQPGDILYSKIRPNLNKIARAKHVGLCSADMYAVIPNDDGLVDRDFLFHTMRGERFYKEAVACSMRSGLPKVNRDDLSYIIVACPPLHEQQRIAAVLDTWDDATLAAQRLTTLAERKQVALFECLFTDDGAATGTLGDYFMERKKWGRAGLPVHSVTRDGGLVPRNQLDRRTESALVDDAHALVEQGDLAYNMMRMWQGALGIADQPCLVSPAYVVMQPLPTVDIRFAAAWMKSPRGLNRLWAYSHGITEDRLRLYADDFLAIPVSFPPLDRQRVIARAHETTAQAAKEARTLANLLRRQKRGLMQKLLTGEWRVPMTGDAFAPGGPAADRLEAAE